MNLSIDDMNNDELLDYAYKHLDKGIVGRWQKWNGYGFTNCETPDFWQKCEKIEND